jgi:hypothetical protein
MVSTWVKSTARIAWACAVRNRRLTSDTKTVMGVETRVVHDVVTLDGRPEEETFDWYAQDADGNVWYFGEDTKKLGGPTVDTSGSFVAGVNGALPRIIMPGRPVVGDQYRQEYAKGEAEDISKVLNGQPAPRMMSGPSSPM